MATILIIASKAHPLYIVITYDLDTNESIHEPAGVPKVSLWWILRTQNSEITNTHFISRTREQKTDKYLFYLWG